MAIVQPFRTFRPIEELAAKIAALPYDVMSSKEAREMVKGNKYSFLHVDRGEINLPENINMYETIVYKTARNILNKMIDDGSYMQEKKPCFYIYEQIMNGRGQKGLVGCASIDDYISNVIKRHEKTRSNKEIDRINHVDYCDAHTGPIFMTYRRNIEIEEIMNKWIKNTPIYDFVSEDGNGHKVWIIDDDNDINKIKELFKNVENLYIADGHHRSASAVKVGLKRRKENPAYTGEEGFNYFLSIIYPENELQVLDYNRTVKDLNGMSFDEFMDKVGKEFDIIPSANNLMVKPKMKHEFGMYIDKKWFVLKAKEGIFDNDNPIERLDVSILQNKLLGPILGIKDPTKSERIEFIGGIRGLKELEKRADTDMKVSFSMFPTTIEDIMDIADVGEVMPPKSTWFEPKPRSGLFIHKLK